MKSKKNESVLDTPKRRAVRPSSVRSVGRTDAPVTSAGVDDAVLTLDQQVAKRRARGSVDIVVDSEQPIEALKKLVRQHRAITKSAVSILNFSRDKIALRDIRNTDGSIRYAKGDLIPCSLPLPVQVCYKEMVKRVTSPELRKIERRMTEILREIPIYREWLLGVFGLGPIICSYLVSEINIRRCTKPSQLIRYCGFAVIDGALERRKAGVKSAYNSELRTRIYQFFSVIWKLCAGQRRNKYFQIWLDGKQRRLSMATQEGKLEVRGRMVSARGVSHSYGWHRAASIFLEDLYTVWRALEGLEVWPGYYAAKLGYEHGGKICVNAPKHLTLPEAIELVGDVGATRLDAPPATEGPATTFAEGVSARDELDELADMAAEEEEEEEES